MLLLQYNINLGAANCAGVLAVNGRSIAVAVGLFCFSCYCVVITCCCWLLMHFWGIAVADVAFVIIIDGGCSVAVVTVADVAVDAAVAFIIVISGSCVVTVSFLVQM